MGRLLICLFVILSVTCLASANIIEKFNDNIVAKTQDVRDSIKPSLEKSIKSEFQDENVRNLLSTEKLNTLENFIQNFKIEMNGQISMMVGNEKITNADLDTLKRIIFQDVELHIRSEFGRGGLLAFIESIMKGMMTALELDLKDVFNALVAPLIDLAIVMNPLPGYQYTTNIMDGDKVMRYVDETFENWGLTLLANVTVRTFFPRTVQGIQNIVKAAAVDGARVRASATRHTFNPWLWGVESCLY